MPKISRKRGFEAEVQNERLVKMNNRIKALRDKSGCSLNECKQALKKCSNFEIAYEYLRLKSQPLVRCKVDKDGNKNPYTDDNYIMLAETMVN